MKIKEYNDMIKYITRPKEPGYFKKGCYVGQENTARIKLKNKLTKRLFPIKVIDGTIQNETISYKDNEVGKILIKGKYPFALIKFKDVNLKNNIELTCKGGIVKVIKPEWIN